MESPAKLKGYGKTEASYLRILDYRTKYTWRFNKRQIGKFDDDEWFCEDIIMIHVHFHEANFTKIQGHKKNFFTQNFVTRITIFSQPHPHFSQKFIDIFLCPWIFLKFLSSSQKLGTFISQDS